MKKNITLIVLLFFSMVQLYGQEEEKQTFLERHPFVNMTELGQMFGRIKIPQYGYWFVPTTDGSTPQNYKVKNISNFTFNTFNGIALNLRTAVGLNIGLDLYDATLIMPLQLGIRQTILKKRESENLVFAALDAGYGSTVLHEDDSDFITKGGLAFNPAIGYKIKMRNSGFFSLGFGYKFQHLSITQNLDNEQNSHYDEYLETRNHHRMTIKVGLGF